MPAAQRTLVALCVAVAWPAASALRMAGETEYPHEPHWSFLDADEALCWETRKSNANFVVQGVKNSPLKNMTKGTTVQQKTCAELGYPEMLMTLDPCHKEVVLWRFSSLRPEFQGSAGKQSAKSYQQLVQSKQQAIFRTCFGWEYTKLAQVKRTIKTNEQHAKAAMKKMAEDGAKAAKAYEKQAKKLEAKQEKQAVRLEKRQQKGNLFFR
mmetsp:Transcript_77961/g.241656  ORF Transcript_77961/g.241656 Transcript_77961/m.241656 type:complete len:210 (-) Transcript_77961:215-844(-)|eukprot:CAMPEP_0204522196 /NCGR_PEP_ID=MMETSP0661-20131031/6186_1 /ASSEMBLY_ACC=CAM_ASM_000606 /TAXON_ID=109239 /ORGANISM="Alexandrium margalefi, Strain AMGDE01CS-322" /LENGTH=209 /DNA_ID=CAMNT_0051527839 /DNA_START=69 /DNA_END=698 /DNA_ORIENTATION=-